MSFIQKTREPVFTIICPVFNSGKFLNNTVQSVLRQTFNLWQLILVNDGSTDNSKSICDYYSNLDSRITVIHKNNQGQSLARIDGIKIAKGEYIVFLDSDDDFKTNELEILNETIKKTGCNMVLFNGTKLDELSDSPVYNELVEKTITDSPDIISECFLSKVAGYLWTYCIKRELFTINEQNLKYYCHLKYSEDMFLIYSILSEKKITLRVLKDQLYLYHIRSNSLSQNQTFNRLKDRFMVYDKIYSSISKKYAEKFKNIDKKVSENVGWVTLSLIYHSGKELTYAQFKEEILEIKKTFSFTHMINFKKDRFNKILRIFIKLGLYRQCYKIIKAH